MNNLPGVIVGRRPSRYNGTADDYIEQLRQEGVDVSWWRRHQSKTPQQDAQPRCGYMAIYFLRGDTAYTKNSDGSPYMAHHKLKAKQNKDCWGCEGCKARFWSWEDAQTHANNLNNKGETT